MNNVVIDVRHRRENSFDLIKSIANFFVICFKKKVLWRLISINVLSGGISFNQYYFQCGINVDMQNFSDTFMTLAALAPFAMTPTTITHIQHARHKESDRLAVTRKELQKLKIRVEEGANGLKIYPGIPQPATIDSHQDHRIAMAFSIIGLRIPGIIIDGADCVNKTCPEFFKLWQRLYL